MFQCIALSVGPISGPFNGPSSISVLIGTAGRMSVLDNARSIGQLGRNKYTTSRRRKQEQGSDQGGYCCPGSFAATAHHHDDDCVGFCCDQKIML